MCGRFTLKTPARILQEYFGVTQLPGLPARYNIAPTQPVGVVVGDGEREWTQMRWGLIPYWAKDPSIGNRMINARAETLEDRPAYREAFARRRCLVPADGFYEWQRLEGGGKQPVYLHLQDETPFAFAGLWDRWRDRVTGKAVRSCAIVTTEPNEVVEPIHDRMPAILERHQLASWLDPDTEPADLLELLRPSPAERLRARLVSTLVNKPDNDLPECIEPIEPVARGRTLFD